MADQSMFSSFLEDMYKELEKPVATQNLDIFLKKLSDVQANIDKSYAHLKDQLSKGIKIDDSKLEGFARTASEATEITNHLNDALKKLSTHKNAQKNFPEQYDKALSTISKMRNVSSNIAQRGQDARYAVHPEEKRGTKEWKEAQKKLEEEKKAEEERIYGKPVDKTTWGKKETPKPQPKLEEKPKEQQKPEEKPKETPKPQEKHKEPEKVPIETKVDEKSDKTQEEKIESLKSIIRDGSSKENAISIDDKIAELRKEVSELEKKAHSKFDSSTGQYIKDDSFSSELEKKRKELEEFLQIRDQWAKEIQGAKQPQNKGVQGNEGTSSNESGVIHSYQDLVNSINLVKEAKDKLANDISSGKSSNFEEDVATLKEYESALKELETLKKNIDKSTPQKPEESAEQTQTQGVISSLKEVLSLKMQIYGQQTALPFSKDFQGSVSSINAMQKSLSGLKSSLAMIGQGGVIGTFKNIASGAMQVAKTVGTVASNGFHMYASAVKTAMSAMVNLASRGFNAAKNGISAMKQGIQNVTSKMHGLAKKATPNVMKTFQSFKSMMMRRLKRTFISAIFNQAKEGIQELAKHSQEFNQAMSSIKNSSKEVAGNLAVTLGSLLTTIAPMLQTILDWFNRILIAFNSFLAMLQGKGSVTVAKQNTDDYAKSLKNASKNAKDLNHQLYGFDEITRQEDNSSNGGSKIGYTEQAVDDRFKDIFNMFKEGKFFEIGKLIGNKISEMAKTVTKKIKELRPVAKKWARNIAQLLNGIIDTDVFESIGEMIGEGLNLAFDAVYNFLDEFDAKNFGAKLAKGFTKLFSSIEWDLIGKTLGTGLSKVWQTVSNFVNGVKWGSLGTKISTGITSFFNSLDFESWRGMVSGSINGIVSLLTNIVTKVNWKGIASKIFSNLKQLFEKDINWESLSNLLSTSVNNLIGIFGSLVDSEVILTIADKLGGLVGDFLSKVDWDTLSLKIALGISQLAQAFANIVTDLDLPNLATQLGGAVNNLFKPVEGTGETPFETVCGAVNTFIEELAKAFGSLVDTIDLGSIRESIGKGISRLINPTRTGYIISKAAKFVLNLATEFGKLVAQIDFNKIASDLATALNKFFSAEGEDSLFSLEKAKALGKALSDGLKNIFKGLITLFEKTDWQEIGTNVGNFLAEAFSNIDWLKLAEDIIHLLWDAIVAATSLATGLLGTVLRKIFGIDMPIDEFKGETEQWANESVDVVADQFENATMSKEQQLLNSAWMWGAGYGEQYVDGVSAGSEEATKRLDQFFLGLINDDPGAIVSAYALDTGDESVKAFLSSIENGETDISMGVGDMMNAVMNMNSVEEVQTWFKQNIGIDLPQTVAEHLLQGKGEISHSGRALITSLVNSKSMEETKAIFAQYGIEVSDEFAESITGTGVKNISAACMLMANGVSDDVIAAMNTSNLSDNLNAYMEKSGESIQDIALQLTDESGEGIKKLADDLGIDVGNILGSTIPNATKEALELGQIAVQGAAQGVANAAKASDSDIAEAISANTQMGEEGVSALEGALSDGKDDVASSTEQLAKATKDPIESLPKEVQPYAEEVIKYIVQALADGDGTVVAAIEAVAQAAVDRAREILNGETGLDIAKTFLDGIYNGIDGTSINNHIINVTTTARAYAESIFSTSNGYSIGANIIIGMINGMNAYGQTLVNTIAHICNVSADTARDILGIASPSKVFAQIGSYTMEGMQIGLENTGEDAINTVSDIANSITKEGQNAKFDMSFSEMEDGLDATTDKLSRIAQIFSDIASTIADMGGLQIPTVASGQVIPYRTKIADSMSSMSGASENNLEDAIYNAFSRAMTGSDAQQEINITLMIDGRKLTDIVTKYQRQQQRAWGV